MAERLGNGAAAASAASGRGGAGRRAELDALDPRLDLADDHELWVGVLWYSRHDRQLQGLLHGLRCGGARLERRWKTDGTPFLKLDYRPLLGWWKEDELRQKWLDPFKERVKAVFEKTARAYEEAIQRRRAG